MRRIHWLAVFVGTFVSSPAFAGFEWVPAVETDRVPMTRAEAVYDNSFDMAPPVLGGAPQGMTKGELVINPYPVSAGYVPGTDPTTSTSDTVARAMMEETGLLSPVALGGGQSTGIEAPTMPSPQAMAKQSAFALDPYPLASKAVESEQLAPPSAPAMMPPTQIASGMSAMPGGEVAPLPGYDRLVTPARPAAMPPMMPPVTDAPVSSYTPSPVMPVGVGNSDYAEAVGFGRDLPLALALSQVVPPQYALSFNTGVDAGSSVSWEGGKPWNQVLTNMLQPLGLKAHISGKTVVIQKI